jgi:adenine-specific DNA-methyltransferase
MNLNLFNTTNLFEAATHLFKQLGITLNSNTTEPLPLKDVLKHYYKDNDTFKSVDKTYFIGIIDDSVFKVTGMFDKNYSYKEAIEQGEKNYNGLMLFALELNRQPTRTEISELTRAFNRISQKMPVALLLKYIVDKQAVFSIAISERFRYLQNWREGEKVGKIIMLRDIYTQNPHTGHIRILQDLVKPAGVNTYAQLHQHWLQVLDISILNKKFFQELSNWYFAVMDKVSFPDDVEKNKEIRNATNLIRLITRVIFIWFLKEKQLVPAYLFSKNFVASILKDFNKNKQSHNYYNAILQNLFFATLNQKIEERKFAKEGSFQTNKGEHGVKNLFRYADLFTIPEKEILELFKDIPFLNGGLFDCLDKLNDEGKTEYVDGFSRNPKKKAIVPDYTFFGKEQEVDLNEVYGTKNKRYTFRGLINILESYKFTVTENTPLEEEIALDPELLGKVFENLLANYNPETQTTARKQTGSFYTPREIVNYMVEESLLEYLKQNVKNTCENFETRLRELISYTETPNLFNREETQAIIEAISNCKILDPACGSGAFPMGILHTMVHILQKLDPENQYWKELQRKKAIQETEQAFTIGDKEERAKRLAEINDVFENNASDYGRKLYLIENCIYGIDIQPIAIQIAKLRFFISLVIDQKVNKSKENFGIRSLPNLETKFVAANTLIGLDKPQQLAIRNPNIEQKEKELKQVRHEYFTANTRKKKIDLQKKDKQLRKKIAELLKDDKWDKKVAEQIASFDPYDQNHFANWFDPEWMFGLNAGFDIVIGNPPYGFRTVLSKEEKEYFRKKENIEFRSGDSAELFCKISFNKLVRQNGILSFIIPKKSLYGDSWEDLRLNYWKKYDLAFILDAGKSFENVLLEASIFGLVKSTSNRKVDLAFLSSNLGIQRFSKTEKEYFFMRNNTCQIYKVLYPASLFQKIQDRSFDTKKITTKLGLAIGQDFFSDTPTSHKLLKGIDIEKYNIRTHRYLKNYEKLKAENVKVFLKPKVITQVIVSHVENPYPHLKIIACFDAEGIAITNTLMAFETDNDIHPKFLLAYLNSKFISWYAYNFIYSQAIRTMHFYDFYIQQIPIPKIKLSNQELFITIVEQILTAKAQGKDTTALEEEIDLLVYKLYDLTYEEVKVIDPAFALSREEYESKALE